MTKYKLFILFITLIVLATVAAKPEVYFYRNNSSQAKALQSKIVRHLQGRVTVLSKGIATSSAVESAKQKQPAAVIVLDNVSARSFRRNGPGSVPVVIATDTKNFGALKSIGATYADKFRVDSVLCEAAQQSKVQTVTFLYIASDRGKISRTASRCRARGIAVKHVSIPDTSFFQIQSTIKGMKNTGSLVYIAWNKKLIEVLQKNTQLTADLAHKSKALISTSNSILNPFKQKATTFLIQRDIRTLAALIAEATAKAVNSGRSSSGSSKLIESAMLIRYTKQNGKAIASTSDEGKAQLARTKAAVSRIKIIVPKEVAKPEIKIKETAKDTIVKKDILDEDTSWADEKKKAAQAKKKATLAKQKKSPNRKRVPQVPKTDTAFVTVTEEVTNIFSQLEPELKLIGVARKGDTFTLLDTVGAYLCINAWGQKGYIHSSSIKVQQPKPIVVEVEEPQWKQFIKQYFLYITITLSLIFVSILTLIIRAIQKGKKRVSSLYTRSALLLSKYPKKVQISSKDESSTFPLAKFLRSLEIMLTPVTSISSFQESMAQHMPDLFIVDWNMDHRIADIIKEQLSKYRLSSATTLLFYHVPDKDRLLLSSGFGQATVYLHSDFPSIEKMELILGEEEHSTETLKEKSDSHLSGALGDSHLEDIIQLLGTSQKSGCLVIEDSDPFAVIYFMNGTIVDAMTRDGKTGQEAIFESLLLSEGVFYFMLNREAPEQTMQLHAMQLLMEWSQYQDTHSGS